MKPGERGGERGLGQRTGGKGNLAAASAKTWLLFHPKRAVPESKK